MFFLDNSKHESAMFETISVESSKPVEPVAICETGLMHGNDLLLFSFLFGVIDSSSLLITNSFTRKKVSKYFFRYLA